METKTYNGWKNYETWAVKLWMDNDSGSYDYWQERTQELIDRDPDDKDGAIYDLSKAIESETKENAPELGATVYADLFNAALSEVDWYEIAESLVTDYIAEQEQSHAR